MGNIYRWLKLKIVTYWYLNWPLGLAGLMCLIEFGTRENLNQRPTYTGFVLYVSVCLLWSFYCFALPHVESYM
jgi:hypothetical protein